MLQGIMEVSTTQRYPLGFAYKVADMVFAYMHSDAERQLRAAYGVFGKVTYVETGAVAVTSPAGSKTVICTAVGTVVANEFAGGKLGVRGGGAILNYGEQYRIKSNTGALGGATFTVTLVDALVNALTIATDLVVLFRPPWANVVSMRQRQVDGVATDWRKVSFIAVPPRFVPANRYCWGQIAGPCIMCGDSGTEGVADSERQMQFGDNGSVLRLRDLGDGLGRHQIAGYVLPVTTAGALPSSLVPIWLTLGQYYGGV